MPRSHVCTHGYDDKDFEHDGDCEHPIDVCRDCARDWDEVAETVADRLGLDVKYVSRNIAAEGGFEADHPPYDEEEYTCDVCGEPLTGEDD
jgi:hypothetical protein